MTFVSFLDRYCLPQQQIEIISVLDQLEIRLDIETIIDEFYDVVKSGNKNEITAQFVLTVRDFITLVNSKLQNHIASEDKTNKEKKVVELAVYLIRDTFICSQLQRVEYFEILRQTVEKTYIKKGWDFSALGLLFNLDNIQAFAIQEKENKQHDKVKLSKPIQFKWMSLLQFDCFIDDLVKTFSGVKTKTLLYKLFDLLETDFKVTLPSKHLVSFLILFYELHKCGVITVGGNRGLFVYLERHLAPPLNDKYPKRSFRKLRHEAEQNEKIKKEKLMMIKPLLDKYCSTGQ